MQLISMCMECNSYDCEHVKQAATKPPPTPRAPKVEKPKPRSVNVGTPVEPAARPSEVLEEQQGRCKLCMDPVLAKDRIDTGKLSFDYDPQTMKPRGVLCRTCKGVVQAFGNKPALFRRAAEYIEKMGEV